VIAGVVTVALVVVAAVGGAVYTRLHHTNGNPQANGTSTTTPPANTPSPTPSPTPTDFTGDLRDLLLTPPSSSSPFEKPITKDGRISQAYVTSEFYDANAAGDELERDQFKAGAAVQWHDDDDTEVTIEIYRFGSARGASSWLQFNVDGYKDDKSVTDVSPIKDIEGSSLYVDKRADNLGFIGTTGLAVKGNLYMIIYVYQVSAHVDRTAATDVMQHQYQQLP
jgi:hypothetical protein